MGSSFAEYPTGRELFEEANDALGFDLKKLCLEGPAEQLKLTENSQPAILTTSVAAYRIFQESRPLRCSFAAGHSLGEYSALVAAGCLKFPDAVRIARQRGKLMQEAVPAGGGLMAALLGKTAEEVISLCEACSNLELGTVEPANFNCRGQIVVSGNAEAVRKILEKAKGVLLEVSAPFHCSLMKPVEERLRPFLDKVEFARPNFPVVANVNALPLTSAEEIPSSLLKQISSPVKWEQSVRWMIGRGIERFVEFGEGGVLSGLMKRIDKSAKSFSFSSPEDIQKMETNA